MLTNFQKTVFVGLTCLMLYTPHAQAWEKWKGPKCSLALLSTSLAFLVSTAWVFKTQNDLRLVNQKLAFVTRQDEWKNFLASLTPLSPDQKYRAIEPFLEAPRVLSGRQIDELAAKLRPSDIAKLADLEFRRAASTDVTAFGSDDPEISKARTIARVESLILTRGSQWQSNVVRWAAEDLKKRKDLVAELYPFLIREVTAVPEGAEALYLLPILWASDNTKPRSEVLDASLKFLFGNPSQAIKQDARYGNPGHQELDEIIRYISKDKRIDQNEFLTTFLTRVQTDPNEVIGWYVLRVLQPSIFETLAQKRVDDILTGRQSWDVDKALSPLLIEFIVQRPYAQSNKLAQALIDIEKPPNPSLKQFSTETFDYYRRWAGGNPTQKAMAPSLP